MKNKMKKFLKEFFYGFVFFAVYFFPAGIAKFSFKMVSAIFTGMLLHHDLTVLLAF